MTKDYPSQIKKARILLGLTQQDVADRIGVSKSAVSVWESGRSAPGPGHQKDLAHLLEIDGPPLTNGEVLFGMEAFLIGGIQLDWDTALKAAQLVFTAEAARGLTDEKKAKALKLIYTMGVKDPTKLRTEFASAIIMSME